MRVLHVINTLSAGGAELHLLTLCRAQRAAGIDPVVACLREHVQGSRSVRPDFAAAGIRVVPLHGERRFDWRAVPRLMRVVHGTAPAVVHSHLPRADLAAALVAPRAGVPLVTSVHHDYSDRRLYRAAYPLLRQAWRRAGVLIAISAYLHGWLVHTMRARPERVRTVHYGIDPAPFERPADATLRRRWGLAARPVIGSLGRLEARKGFETLIAAMCHVRARIPDACLVIGGHDPHGRRAHLETLARDAGVGEAVRFVGAVDDVPSFLHAIDVFAFASRSEGFGQVVLEAMAAARPVVVSRIAPLTEIVPPDGDLGWHADADSAAGFADAVVRLLTDRALRSATAVRARRRVQTDFSVSAMAGSIDAAYRAVLPRAA